MRRSLAALLTVACLACVSGSQRADDDYRAQGSRLRDGSGIRVFIDEAHFNFHTREGRYAPFAAELESAGYAVGSWTELFDTESLAPAQVLVIANALAEETQAEWVSPTPSAFSPDEIAALVDWIRDGGRLLLIADHMPFPGAAEDLALELGFRFHNGFAFEGDSRRGNFLLTAESGLLRTEPLRGFADDALADGQVKVFTGQAFELLAEDAEPVLLAPAGTKQLLPEVAWEFDDSTEAVPSDGFAMGALREVGAGRVAVFGEAAMFTSQVARRDGREIRMGLSHPDATGNAALLHGVMAWLADGLGR